jgi:hypothetical protein
MAKTIRVFVAFLGLTFSADPKLRKQNFKIKFKRINTYGRL